MSDITAVVLSIGEDTTKEATESASKQSLPPKEIIVVRNVTPFYNALNIGASKVTTEFFVQVDADMTLDENCLRDLRDCMDDDVGIVLGQLRDPLMGKVGWIKMFRKECFDVVQYRDLVAQDIAFKDDISRHGWKTVYAQKSVPGVPKELWHTFGEHRPSYTPHYTFSKYLVEGRRHRYRKTLSALLWHFRELAKSDHPAALIAQIAMAHGLFIREDRDLLKPYQRNLDFDCLKSFLATTAPYRLNSFHVLPVLSFSAERVFNKNYKRGVKLRQAGAFPAFKHAIETLTNSHDPLAWIAKVALCHGLFRPSHPEATCAEEYALLEEFLSAYHLGVILKGKLKCALLALQTFAFDRCGFNYAKTQIKGAPARTP
jgi:hypothetical protein